jgi:peroxiredoxin
MRKGAGRTRSGRDKTPARRPSASSEEARLAASRRRSGARRRKRGLTGGMKTGLVVGLAVVALAAIYFLNRPGGSSKSGDYTFAVGSPGPGQQAPPIRLPSTDGGTFDLSSLKGERVLLYFQEGLTCQPCWDQIKDIQSNMGNLRALGIDEIVSITTDPLDALKQKVSDEGLTVPVLSDPNLAVSQTYSANQYGMMGTSRDGHSFILVGPDGTIEWRADYGGPPDFTMYVPVSSLIADLRTGLRGTA